MKEVGGAQTLFSPFRVSFYYSELCDVNSLAKSLNTLMSFVMMDQTMSQLI